MADFSLSQILQARLHLTLAQSGLPGPLRQTNTTLIRWLDALSVGPALVDDADAVDVPHLDFESAVTADFRRMTWRAAGPPALMADAMQQFFRQVGVDQEATTSLATVVDTIKPQTLGAWVEAVGEDVDTGWYLPLRIPLTTALAIAQPLAPHSPVPDKISTWAAAQGADTCLRLARSIAPGNPFTELRIALPGSTVDEWVLAGVRLFAALGIADLPDEALGEMLNTDTNQMVASVWFTDRGVVKAGLLVADPTLALTLDLFRVATGAQHAADYSALAQYQGSLQVDGPSWVEAQQRANGFGTEYHYALTG